ncbi:efflux RND transporter periplasmic adaptor subunit [Thioalkalivibrio paradoxus]|nr:efflux RND transporter periplasmic adaptor subunit [Thioalkalivibrio paradoxus]
MTPSRVFLAALAAAAFALAGVVQAQYGRVITAEAAAAGEQTISGTVVPFREVTLTAQIGGRVTLVAGAEGDFFDRDEVLVAISDERLTAQRRQALAELRSAEAAMREAQMQYGREVASPRARDIGQMPGMGIPSMFDQLVTRPMGSMAGMGDPTVERQADLYSRYIGIDQAASRWQQARSRLEEIDSAIRDTRSVAPFSGLIMHKHVEEGDTVQPGHPLVTFGHVEFLRVEADIPARLVGRLRVGDMVRVTLDVGKTEVDARVAQIFPIADPQRHTVTVKFDLPRGVPGGPGMYADVHIPGTEATPGVVRIPLSAIVPGGALPRVAVVEPDGTTRVRMVRLGSVQGDMVTVLSGLEPGDRLLDSPDATIRSGERVEPGTGPRPSGPRFR